MKSTPGGRAIRRKAIEKMKTDPLILEAVAIEPRLQEFLEAAKNQKNVPGYHRIRRYYDLKELAYPLVGWNARDRRIKSMKHFDAIVLTIGDLLPEDDVDLYPEGKPEHLWTQADYVYQEEKARLRQEAQAAPPQKFEFVTF